MDTSKPNVCEPQAAAKHELDPQASGSGLLFIDLDLLDDNPYQPRAERDPLKAAQLRESIANQGQLQPILVRRVGTRWQIIYGHGRVEALRKLRSEATTQVDRSRYSKVRAEERSNVSDEQMVVLGLMENIQREDISPLDCAAALARLKSLRPELQTTEDIAREVRMDQTKVKRLLRLLAAPQVIKDAITKGKQVAVPSDADDTDSQTPVEKSTATRRLDASSALELIKLHEYWLGKSAEEPVSAEGTPETRIAALIDRALDQEWGLRRVHAEVDKLILGGGDRSEGTEGALSTSQKDTVPFKVNRTKLVIFTRRLDQMNEAQKVQLRNLLEPIWTQLRGQREPLIEAEVPHRTVDWAMMIRLWKQMIIDCGKLWRILQKHVFAETPARADHRPPPVLLRSDAGRTPANGTAPSPAPQLLPEGLKVSAATVPVPPTAEQKADAPTTTAKPEASAQPTTRNGSEHQLSS